MPDKVEKAESNFIAQAEALTHIAARVDEHVEDPAERRKVKYLDAPSNDANEVTVTAGVPCATEVYERIFQNGAKVPSFVKRYNKGAVPLATHYAFANHFRNDDFNND